MDGEEGRKRREEKGTIHNTFFGGMCDGNMSCAARIQYTGRNVGSRPCGIDDGSREERGGWNKVGMTRHS